MWRPKARGCGVEHDIYNDVRCTLYTLYVVFGQDLTSNALLGRRDTRDTSLALPALHVLQTGVPG